MEVTIFSPDKGIPLFSRRMDKYQGPCGVRSRASVCLFFLSFCLSLCASLVFAVPVPVALSLSRLSPSLSLASLDFATASSRFPFIMSHTPSTSNGPSGHASRAQSAIPDMDMDSNPGTIVDDDDNSLQDDSPDDVRSSLTRPSRQ